MMFLQTIGPETEGIRRRIYETEYLGQNILELAVQRQTLQQGSSKELVCIFQKKSQAGMGSGIC